MGEPERLFFRRACGSILAALVVTISCSTVDKVKPPLPPGGSSPSGAELVTDEPQEAAVDDYEYDDYEYEDFEQEEEPILEDEMDSTITESEPDQPDDESLVVIDTGAKDLTVRPETLAEAARAERERRDLAPPTDIVITDKTLAEFATGDLTVTETPNDKAAAAASGLSELEKDMAAKEAYWRQTAREIRQGWRDAYDNIEELEAKVFDLRQQFYREDDGFYRDAEIKPAWDRAIDQLEESRFEVEARQRELEEFLEAGRQAGAFPGWLREGIELEPKPAVSKEPIAEPTEPVIYQPESSDPP